MPNSMKWIGESAFMSCGSLISVEIPSGVTSIGKNAFASCGRLMNIEVPNAVTHIGEDAFLSTGWWNAKSSGVQILDGWVLGVKGACNSDESLPNGTKGLADGAFSGCGNLYHVTLPDSVTMLGTSLFSSCSSLRTISIPRHLEAFAASLQSGNDAMMEVRGVKDIIDGIAWFYSIDEHAGTSVLAGNTSYIGSMVGDVVVPATLGGCPVKAIPDGMFSGCEGLTGVVIPDGVTQIGNSAFSGCSGLTDIVIPDSVTSIGDRVFDGCSSLETISIPPHLAGYLTMLRNGNAAKFEFRDGEEIVDGITWWFRFEEDMGGMALVKHTSYSSSMVGNVVVPATLGELPVRKIDDELFQNCDEMTGVVLPDGVTSIGDYAFDGCIGLTSIEIPGSVTSIGDGAFAYCSGLTGIVIPNGVTSIGDNAFYGCSGLTDVVISDGVMSIGYYAFASCSGLVGVEIPSSVISIEDGAFYGCSGLTDIVIPDGVTSIGYYPFDGCSSLETISIPVHVEKYSTTLQTGNTAQIEIRGTKTEVVGGIGWVYCIDSEVGGAVLLGDASYVDSLVGDVVIPTVLGGCPVKRIGNSAVSGCEGLTGIVIPESVTSIGDYAFDGCDGLIDIIIPAGVTSIGSYAFNGCSGLTNVVVPDAVTSIGWYPFCDCSSLRMISIPLHLMEWSGDIQYGNTAKVKIRGTGEEVINGIGWLYYIDEEVGGAVLFKDATFVDSMVGDVVIPATLGGRPVKTISDQLFLYCANLTSIVMPDSVVSLGEDDWYGVFEGCSSLTNVVLSGALSHLPSNTFLDCGSLIHVTIPDSVTSLGDGVFSACPSLQTISIPKHLESFVDSLKSGNSAEVIVRSGDAVDEIIGRIPSSWFDDYKLSGPASDGDYATVAKGTAANGMKVWECYVAGLDPTNEVSRFEARIEFTDGKPVVTWTPDLNVDGVVRTYTVVPMKWNPVTGKLEEDEANVREGVANGQALDATPNETGVWLYRVKVALPKGQ